MRWPVLAATALFLLAAGRAGAGAELVLRDGGVLSGETVERTKDGLYLLATSDGAVLTIPVELVKSLRLTGGEDPAPTGIQIAEPRVVGGPPDPPPLPSPKKQLAAFGRPPASFATGSVSGNWVPQNALGPDVSQFNPARWYQFPRSFEWTPVSAFRVSTDVTSFNPVRWYRPATDSTWRPTDGFR